MQQQVISEFESFLLTKPKGEFDLNMASPSYRELSMTYANKPAAEKARLGRLIAKAVKTGTFAHVCNVVQVFDSNGNLKRSIGNRAALYQIV